MKKTSAEASTEVRRYLSRIGQRGGRKSRRHLSPKAARNMVKVREARRAYRDFHAACFWSFDPSYKITTADVPWVARQLMQQGGRTAWEKGVWLSR